MYVCIVTHMAKVCINRARLPILLLVSRTGKMNISLSAFAPENLVSRDGFGSPVPRLLMSILRLYLVPTYGIPPEFRGGVHFLFKTAIRHRVSPEFYRVTQLRWRSLPRARRHRAGKPQGSSEQGLPWQVTMDQFICASLSHTHYWY